METGRLLILVAVIVAATTVVAAVNSSQYTAQLTYKEDTALANKSANLTCFLSRFPFWRAPDKVRWWKSQSPNNVTVEISRGSQRMIPDQDKPRYYFTMPVQEFSTSIAELLIIRNIKAEDQGFYRCGVYIENDNTSITSNEIFVKADISAKVNLSSTAEVADGVSVYKKYSQRQSTSCTAYVFGDRNNITMQVWDGDQDITRYFTTVTNTQITGAAEGFRSVAVVVTSSSASYLPKSKENAILRCEARRNNIVIANSSMVVKLNDTHVMLKIIQKPAVAELGEALQLQCVPEQYDISNKTEFTWTFVLTGSSGVPMTMQLRSGEQSDIAEATFTENLMQLNMMKYSGRLSNFTVTLRDNGSTIATMSFNLALQIEKVIPTAAIVTATTMDFATWNSSQYTVRLAYKEGTAKTNTSANLTCFLSRSPFWRAGDLVRWWKTQPSDNVTVEISPDSQRMISDQGNPRYYFTSLVQTSNASVEESLIIQNIKAEDKGFYRCGVYAENDNNSSIASNPIFVEPVVTPNSAAAWKTHEAMLIFTVVMSFVMKPLF